MKRKLNEVETKATKLGIKNRTKRINTLSEELDYLKSAKSFNEKWAEYLENQRLTKEKEQKTLINKTIKYLEDTIKFEKDSLIGEKLQLKEGVEIKQTSMIN